MMQLRDFVDHHKLMIGYPIATFVGIVNLTTSSNSLEKFEIEINVNFRADRYGAKLYFHLPQLDASLYPTIFSTEWETFEHVNQTYLSIVGHHLTNEKIGKYKATIVPTGRKSFERE